MIKAFIFGSTLALSVGPIALIILNNGIQHGHGVAIRSALGAATADFIFALIAFVSGALLLSSLLEYQVIFASLSSVVLIIFGIYMIWGAVKHSPSGFDAEKRTKPVGFRGTLFLTIVNPLTIIAFSAFLGQSNNVANSVEYSLMLAFFVFLGSLLVQVSFALFGTSLRSLFHNYNHVRLLQLLSGIGISAFGLIAIVR